MKLTIVGPAYPLRGGIALHTAELASEARARGHAVEVISFRRLYPSLLFPGRSQLDPEPPPETWVRHPAKAMIDSLSPLSWQRAGRAVAAFRADIAFFQRWHPYFAPALAAVARHARQAGAMIVWMVHNLTPHETRSSFWGPLLAHGIDSRDVCLTHAETVARELLSRRHGLRVETLRHPAPASLAERADRREARQALGIRDDEVVFLFFGYVRRYKGVDVLLDALTRLDPDGPAWRALIVGEWYIDRSDADARVSRPPLEGRVEIADRYVPNSEVATYFAASSVVVAPYRDGTQSGVVPIAYAHGRGVIAGNVGGLAEAVSVPETGLLVPPDDPVALAQALEEVRHGRRFSGEAIAAAHAASSWVPIVEFLERVSSDSHRRSS